MSTRRKFLADVGSGMLTGALGASLALDLGVTTARAAEAEGADSQRLSFGDLEPLVAMMQETPLEQLQPTVVEKLREGVELQQLVQAATLANARAFGGQDYVGYHTFMALAPALDMARRLPADLRPFPVLKVLYRNTERIHASGHTHRDTLKPLETTAGDAADGAALQRATRDGKLEQAEQLLQSMKDLPRGEIFNHVQYSVHDATNVHRVVLAWRSWLAIDLVGEQYAQTLLRQSVRFAIDSSRNRLSRNRPEPSMWSSLPKLLDQYRLLSRPLGTRSSDDKWVEDLAFTIFTGSQDIAADAVAQALAEGFSPEVVGEAISLAANMQLLHDPGRPKAANYDKVVGSVHGDSVGVHASDATNAWRNIARVSNQRNAVVSLLVAARNTAGMQQRMKHEPWPLKHDEVSGINDAKKVLGIIEDAVRDKDQALAGAAVQRWQELGGKPGPIFQLMLRFATSEDGALHAEKFFRTVTEEFAATRKSLRWRQLVGLARVTASEFGTKAPGYEEACDLLGKKIS